MFVRAGVRQDERPSAAVSIQPDSGKLYLVRERESKDSARLKMTESRRPLGYPL